MRNKLAMVLVAMGSLALVSCGDDVVVPSDVTVPSAVVGEWWLVSFVRPDGSQVSITPSPEFSVRFGANGAMSIRVHCNSCGGSYQLQGEQLTGDLGSCSWARCTPSPVDVTFQDVFDGGSWVTRADELLRLTSDRGTLVLEPVSR